MISELTDEDISRLIREDASQANTSYVVKDSDSGEYFVKWPAPDPTLQHQPATRLEQRRATREQAHKLVAAGIDWRGLPADRP
jgi:hypothetical protein